MRSNRYQKPYPLRGKRSSQFLGLEPAWLALAVTSTGFIAGALFWLL
jgi:hypothetical protein